jgi:hypothetical protein
MRNLVRIGSTALVIAALLMPQTLDAQERKGRWSIFPYLGLVAWDNAAAVQDPVLANSKCSYPELGMDCSSLWNNLQGGIAANYFLTETFQIGLAVDASRPISNGAYFPAVEMEVAGTQSLSFVNQRLTIVDAMLQVEWMPTARFAPFVNAGVGWYVVWPEANKSDQFATTGFESFSDLMVNVGVGLDWRVGTAAGFRIQVGDQIFTGWERDKLYPIFKAAELPNYATELYPDLADPPPEDKTTLHNFRLLLGFTFMPGS